MRQSERRPAVLVHAPTVDDRSTQFAGVALAVAAALSGGISGPAMKLLSEAGLSPGGIALLRAATAALLLAPVCIWQIRSRWRATVRSGRSIVAYGVVGIAGLQYCYTQAIQTIPVGLCLMIQYAAPIVILIGRSVHRRRMPPRTAIAGSILVVVGLLVALDVVGVGRVDIAGVAWSFGALGCVLVFFVVGSRSTDAVPPALFAGAGMVVAAVAVAILGLTGLVPIMGPTGAPAGAGLGGLAGTATALLVLVGTVGSYLATISASTRIGSERTSFIALLGIPATFAFAWLLASEHPTPNALLGAVAVTAGLVVATTARRPRVRIRPTVPDERPTAPSDLPSPHDPALNR